MVVYKTIGPLLLLLMVVLPSFSFAVEEEGGSNLFDYKDLEEAFEADIPWPLIFYMGKRPKQDKRSLSGTQDWGKRSVSTRPLRMGKRNFHFDRVIPVKGGKFKIRKPHSLFGFK
jgi:hypothetical protein